VSEGKVKVGDGMVTRFLVGEILEIASRGLRPPLTPACRPVPAPWRKSEFLSVKALRKSLLKYKLHKDQELFDRAYAYIREYY
jgi:hypothetical protein